MSDNSGSAGCSLPVVFLGASALAYFGMPQIDDSVTRAVAAGVVGLGTSVAGGLTATAVALTGGIIGSFGGRGGALALAFAGAVAGGITGIYYGYSWTKDAMIDYVEQNKPKDAATQTLSPQEINKIKANNPAPVANFESQSIVRYQMA